VGKIGLSLTVLKGGTSLAIHHLNNHRESEDLDFDADISLMGKERDIAEFIENILEKMVENKELNGYRISKQGMAATNRYHMNIYIRTHKEMQTKVDLDFVKLPPRIEYEGELGFYTIERMFVGKLISYSSRREFKDLFDIKHLLKKVEPKMFPEPKKLSELIDNVLEIMQRDDLIKSYKKAFRNIDLRFKDLKEPQVNGFVEKTKRELRTLRNELNRI